MALYTLLAWTMKYYLPPAIPTFAVVYFTACASSRHETYPIPKECLYFVYSMVAAAAWPATAWHWMKTALTK